MATKFDKEVLLSAGYATLTGEALSAQALKLRHKVDALVDLQAQRQRAMGAGTAQRAAETLDAFLADLLKAAMNEASQGFLCRPMGGGTFSNAKGCKASYRLFTAYFDAMQKAQLIEVLIGFRRRIEFDGFEFTSKGQMTRIRATQALLDLAVSSGVEPETLSQHYLIAPTIHEVVRVKADSKGVKEGQGSIPKKVRRCERSLLRCRSLMSAFVCIATL